jgi:hypothetical protein
MKIDMQKITEIGKMIVKKVPKGCQISGSQFQKSFFFIFEIAFNH